MANAETVDAVEVEVRIAASPETVFDFFTEPDRMIQWMGRSAQLDPRPGGGFRCDINDETVAAGEYVDGRTARTGSSSPGAGRARTR